MDFDNATLQLTNFDRKTMCQWLLCNLYPGPWGLGVTRFHLPPLRVMSSLSALVTEIVRQSQIASDASHPVSDCIKS